MVDYIKALEEGFEAARKADRARKEIEETLTKFKEDILKASKGKLLIEVKEFVEEESAAERFARISVLGSPQSQKTYHALAAANPTVEKSRYKVLARWKQSKEGYPCSIILPNQEVQLEDRTALERGLAWLLKDPTVGETLYVLTKAK